MAELVLTITDGNVLHIRLNRPDKKNALTLDMYRSMAVALERADQDPAIRVTTISGCADSFTSGNDLVDFLQASPQSNDNPTIRFLQALSTATKPIIAGVNGVAIGIGVTMLLHCDLVCAAETATFQLPFVNLGLVPEAASSLLLPKLAGHQRAAELLLLGDRFDAATAHRIGLVNRLHSADALESELRKLAATLAAKPPAAVRFTKALLKADSGVPARLAEERKHFEHQLRSPEAREAMEAFLQKRKPDFSRFA